MDNATVLSEEQKPSTTYEELTFKERNRIFMLWIAILFIGIIIIASLIMTGYGIDISNATGIISTALASLSGVVIGNFATKAIK